jgi:Protein of unknown function (DUF559)
MDIKSKIEDLACDFAAKIAASSIELADNETESPIEALLLTAIRMHSLEVMDAPDIRYVQKTSGELFLSSEKTPDVILVTSQFQFNQYRVDFMATMFDGFASLLVIECDGHEWHEKTKEQASSDKKRDRYFVMKGICVLRFSGSEIRKYGLIRWDAFLI